MYGSGFKPNKNATCVVGAKEYEPLDITWNAMLCPLPAYDEVSSIADVSESKDSPKKVNLEVTLNGADYHKFLRGFYYYLQPNITDIEPRTGPITGGALLTIYGDLFMGDFELANLTCAIGPYTTPGILVDKTTVSCITPHMERPSNTTEYPVKVAINGQDFTE